MKKILCCLILLSACSSSDFFVHKNYSDCRHTETQFRCVEYLKNYDGDTINFNIHDEHKIIAENIGVRLNGVDTPEMRSKNSCEKTMAKKAKEYVKNRLKNARYIDLRNIKRGKYFRIVADVVVNNRYISKELLKKGLAVPYDGGTKPKVNWCEK